MRKFIECPALLRRFEVVDEFCIANIGYDDFHVVRAWRSFYTQQNYTLHFVLSGEGTLEIGDRCYHLTEGDMFFIPPDVQMRYYPRENNPWEYVWFTLKGSSAVRYGGLLGFSLENAAQRCPHFQSVWLVLHDVFEGVLHDESGYFGVLSGFYRIMEMCTPDEYPRAIHGIKKMIDGSFTLPGFSVEQLCRNAGISHAHLLRLFKKAYGVTISAYILRKRIELACELLETTETSVSSIAFSCGFTDTAHFMKTFKSKTGLSATAYRNSKNR